MTKIVFDTSAVLKILIRPNRVMMLHKIRQPHKLITNKYILDEVERILHQKFGQTVQRAKAITRSYTKNCHIIGRVNYTETNPPLRDPLDNPIANLCIDELADILITDDKDLLLAKIPGTKIITFKEFIALNK